MATVTIDRSDRFDERKNASPLWFIFDQGRILVKRENGRCAIPDASELEAEGIRPAKKQVLGSIGERECFAAEGGKSFPSESGFEFVPLRALFGIIDDELVLTAGIGNQLLEWNRAHRFCGRCGSRTENKADERAKVCPECGLLNYPRLSPAVIVAVVRDNRLLLARNKRFKRSFYSVLAGFVEPGETLEQCVEREVFEETGISVNNIRYFGSQPWPFPDSLMIGFTADYAGGKIRTDGDEIAEADWFFGNNLPSIPPPLSIARQLIDWFVDSYPSD